MMMTEDVPEDVNDDGMWFFIDKAGICLHIMYLYTHIKAHRHRPDTHITDNQFIMLLYSFLVLASAYKK